MTATNPIQIDGKTYDRYSLNLAINGKYNPDGTSDAQVAMRLIPTRIDANGLVETEDGLVETALVETADESAQGIVLGTLAGTDEATAQAVGTIQSAIKAYLVAKGF
jgi:hypothetical protein